MNQAILSLKNIVCIAMWLLVMYSNCFKIQLLPMLHGFTIKVCLCLVLFITASCYKIYIIMIIHGITFALPGF